MVYVLALGMVGCTSSGALALGEQPPVETWLVVHADPLVGVGDAACVDPTLEVCASLSADAFFFRVDNWRWLAETWRRTGRTVDLQMGPEMALLWAGDEATAASLVHGAGGARADAMRVAEAADVARDLLGDLLDQRLATLGVHVHTQLLDPSGLWGTPAAAAAAQGGQGDPCGAFEGAPAQGVDPALEERVVALGASAGARLGDLVGADLTSFTGHFPVRMQDKIRVVTAPDDIDPSTVRDFPTSFRPANLGSALMECLTHAVDHQAFEPWPAHPEQALLAGDGPLVVPGERVTGTLAPHLGRDRTDGSVGVAGRRLLQLLLNRRAAALRGDTGRPWVFPLHAHLFDLGDGTPNPLLPAARHEVGALEGNAYRGDLEGIASYLDELGRTPVWGGVTSDGPGAARWVRATDLSLAESGFSWGAEGEAPPTEVDEVFPYLPLVTTELEGAHLVCRGASDGVLVFGLLRCADGWAWGDPAPGYACADGAEPDSIAVLVPEDDTCVSPGPSAWRGTELDAASWEEIEACGDGGVFVPRGAALLEVGDWAWVEERCGVWR